MLLISIKQNLMDMLTRTSKFKLNSEVFRLDAADLGGSSSWHGSTYFASLVY